MSAQKANKREIREILVAANSDEASPEQIARLDELVRADAELAHYAAQLLDQQAALAWQSGRGKLPRGEPHDAAPRPGAPASSRPATFFGWRLEGLFGREPALGLAAAFILGLGMASVYWRMAAPPDLELAQGSGAPAAALQPYEAQLVRGTACLWDPTTSGSLAVGSQLTSGESLHLLEGLAEFNLTWSSGGAATVNLEGPAAMMLNNEGMPILRFGKVTATISARQRPFVLETSVGRLVLRDYGSIGVSAFGNDAEIHVFDGTAALESAWDSPSRDGPSSVALAAGDALRIKAGDDGQVIAERHEAEQSFFVTQMSMASDALNVPPAYVEAVKKAGPLGYWRMERDAWPKVPNEMGPGFLCLVGGSLGRSGHGGNQAVEFGVTDSGGEIYCTDMLDGLINESYTIEVWLKPSHYHVGAVASLIGQPETPSGVIPHGMLLEMGGSGHIPTAVHHPGRIRFLHRSPASNDSQMGTSCYTDEAYTLRKWQHVVAVKDRSTMRLYVNGQLAGEAADDSELPRGLRLLVGRLYPNRQVRPFKGQLDELALYNRALTAEEAAAHYRLVRPQAPASGPQI